MTELTKKYQDKLTAAQWADIADKELKLAKQPGFDVVKQARLANVARYQEFLLSGRLKGDAR